MITDQNMDWRALKPLTGHDGEMETSVRKIQIQCDCRLSNKLYFMRIGNHFL